MTNHTSTTATSYGSWNNYNLGAMSPRSSVLDAMSGGDIEWIERMEAAGAIDQIVTEYVEAVASRLPAGVTLGGDEFTGPHSYIDGRGEAIKLAIEAADGELSDIIERHDVDLVPAASTPKHDIERPTVARIHQIMAEASGMMGMELTDDGDLRYTIEGDVLTAETVHEHWADITPDTNEGYISDPETTVVMGAIMGTGNGPFLWVRQ